jgi:hypothetical protein
MSQSGSEFRNTNQKKYHPKEERLINFIMDEILLKMGSKFVWL